MTRLLIPDSGPLFSLAAGNLLGVLANFRLGITDVVKQETIDKGRGPRASYEAKQLLKFFTANRANITIMPTQVGYALRAIRLAHPRRPVPANAGELSMQSLLIRLQVTGVSAPPVILFEDSWFLRNQKSLAKPCVLICTEAFLINAEKLAARRIHKSIVYGRCRDDVALAGDTNAVEATGLQIGTSCRVQQFRLRRSNALAAQYFARHVFEL